MRAALFCCLIAIAFTAVAAEPPPYLGHWSNGRGETLEVTEKTLRFADDAAVRYRDITADPNGTLFELQILARGEVNAFPGKTLIVLCDEDSMEITGYASHEDFVNQAEPQMIVTWYRESEESDEED